MSRSWGDLSPPQRRFVAAAKQDNDCIADCDEVEAIARAAGKAHFAYSFADRLYLAWVAKLEPTDAGNNPQLGSRYRSSLSDLVKVGRLANFDHV